MYLQRHPTSEECPSQLEDLPYFSGRIHVYHSATAQFYAPSDLCGAGGMYREQIRSNPSWYGSPRHDTVFVSLDDVLGMQGMVIAQVHLFLSFRDPYLDREFPCALVSWFVRINDEPDRDTGMWVVSQEWEGHSHTSPLTLQVIHLESIARDAHLLPVFGTGFLSEDFPFTMALDSFEKYFVNKFADHHTHQLLAE